MTRRGGLGEEARRLIDAARLEAKPSASACERMERKLAPLLAPSPGARPPAASIDLGPLLAAGRGTALPRQSWKGLAASAGLTPKVAMTSVALMVGAFWLGRTSANRAEPASSVVKQAAYALPSETLPVPPKTQRQAARAALPDPTQSAPRAETVPADPAPDSARLQASRPAPRKPAGSQQHPSASDDIDALGQVEVALRRGNPKTALAKLAQIGTPTQPPLQRLANVLRAITLCELGQLDEGRRLMAQQPEVTPFGARLAHACQPEH